MPQTANMLINKHLVDINKYPQIVCLVIVVCELWSMVKSIECNINTNAVHHHHHHQQQQQHNNFVNRINYEGNSTNNLAQVFDLMTISPGGYSNYADQATQADQTMNNQQVGQLYALGANQDQLGLAQTQLLTAPIAGHQAQQLEPDHQPIGSSMFAARPPQPQVNLYIDQFGNQQLGPPVSAAAAPQLHSQQSNYDRSQSRLVYLNPSGPAIQSSFYDNQEPRVQQQQQQEQQQQQQQQQLVDHSNEQEQSQPPTNKLSNSQLIVLIDELKDFNQRQSKSNGSSGGKRPAQSSSMDISADDGDDDEHDIEPDPSSIEAKHSASAHHEQEQRPNGRPTERQQRQGQQEDLGTAEGAPEAKEQLTTDDLERFAQFLMTKEGANMRFQLGLDKDSPDDGEHDGDERDVLLESKQSRLNREKPAGRASTGQQASLNELDLKVGSQMERLIEELMDKYKEAAAKKLRQKKKKSKATVEADNEDEALARRARRDTSDDHEPGSSKIQVTRGGGQSDEDYPKAERRRDHIALIHDLQRARKNKASLRSRSSAPSMLPSKLPEDSILKQSLDRQLGMQTARYPDGKLVIGTAKGPLVSLQLPRQEDQTQSVPQASAQSDGTREELVDSVKFKANEGSLAGEYPINKRVSDRLAKLNHNLDRYFNDGFLRQVDENYASKVDANTNGAPEDPQPASSSNANEAPGIERRREAADKTAGKAADTDFDVNVSIDGERDEEDEPDDDHSQLEGDSKRAMIKKPPSKGSGGRNSVRRKRRRSPMKLPAKRASDKLQGTATTAPRDNNDDEGGSLRNDLSAGVQQVTFENRAPATSSGQHLDPVDSEGPDTPIGPDGDPAEQEQPMPSDSDRQVASSHQSRNVAQKFGNNPQVTAVKFYEEPEW